MIFLQRPMSLALLALVLLILLLPRVLKWHTERQR
jgi:TctA family transporter